MSDQAILWRRLDRAGHEAARLHAEASGWRLAGTAVFAHEGQACRLDYAVHCDGRWHTVSGRVAGFIGTASIDADLSVDAAGCWRLNGTDCPAVEGCVGADLEVSAAGLVIHDPGFCRAEAGGWRRRTRDATAARGRGAPRAGS